MSNNKPKVAIIMGSNSDWPIMEKAANILDDFGINYETKVISAHRTPDLMFEFASNAKKNGFEVIIAGAGGSAHLPGMVPSKTTLPVLGVPVPTKHLAGQDSLLSIVQIPKGIPVGTFAIGEAGAANAGLFAASILALHDASIQKKLDEFRQQQESNVLQMKLEK